MAIILGIESTCDETAAAVVVDGTRVLSSVVSSQVELHAKYRGVVPEIASRAHIENILPVVREAVATAGVEFPQLDAIAVAHRPGLVGSLLIGVTAAKTMAWALEKPLIGVDHVQRICTASFLNDAESPAAPPRVPKPEKNPAKYPAKYPAAEPLGSLFQTSDSPPSAWSAAAGTPRCTTPDPGPTSK